MDHKQFDATSNGAKRHPIVLVHCNLTHVFKLIFENWNLMTHMRESIRDSPKSLAVGMKGRRSHIDRLQLQRVVAQAEMA